MTDTEWKAFNKAKGTTVYIPRNDGYPTPWQIESAYRRGATLYRVIFSKYGDDKKERTFAPYQQMMTEAQSLECARIWEETNAWRKEERVCTVCGQKFKPHASNQKTCSKKCAKKQNKIHGRNQNKANKSKELEAKEQ